MTDIMTAFGPMVALQILYSLLFLAGAAVVFAAMDRMKRIRARYGLVKLSLRYAVPYLAHTLSPKIRQARAAR
jgi:hypothetical protein